MSRLMIAKVCLLVLPWVFSVVPTEVMAQSQCVFPTIRKNVNGIENMLSLQWDPNNPDEVGQSSSVTIGVINGIPNFTWQVSGNDFWFDADYTITSITSSGRTVILYAGPNACGAASITVIDSSDPQDQVSGSVREPNNGHWVNKGAYCGLSASGQATETAVPYSRDFQYEYILGNKRQYHLTKWQSWRLDRTCPDSQCIAQCTPGGPYACDPCLDWIAEQGIHRVPCSPNTAYGGADCWYNKDYAYYEWECP